ncbi:MAG: alpha/beta fold hydrolase [Pseudomonadota bacterium]
MFKIFMNSLAAILLIGACTKQNSPETTPGQMSETVSETTRSQPDIPSPSRLQAQLVEIKDFQSEFVQPRNITVWLPEGYLPYGDERYPVIYAHDGQNLFEPGYSYGGVEWGLDETAEQLMKTGNLRPAIIVGIWNTDKRWQEYAPQKVIENISGDIASEWLGTEIPALYGDAYLRFIVEELKPHIDAAYETAPDRTNTYIMGSSMGGLISLYAAAEYPDTFSRAAAVSIHWPLADPESSLAPQATEAMQAYLATSALDKTRQRIWFDNGTETLDQYYPPYATAMEAWFREQGWSETAAQFHTYDGTEHSEAAWAARTDDILRFLLEE